MSHSNSQHFIALAEQRGQAKGLSYMGELTPTETWDWLKSNPEVMIVDVRTQAEQDWVGYVSVPDEQHTHIEWNTYPAGQRNAGFIDELSQRMRKDQPVAFLCRSGVRSHQAAVLAAQNGFAYAVNIIGGFEGDKDEKSHRGLKNGWKFEGLPWAQN